MTEHPVNPDRTYRTEQDRTRPNMEDGAWLNLGEAARHLGTTPDAIRQRIRRNKMLARRGNDGRPLVFVESGRTAQAEQTTEICPVIPNRTESGNTEHGESALVVELRQRIADTARQLAERDSLHIGHVERLMAQAAAERSLWLERVDAAEIRAERVEQRLDQVLDALLSERRQPVPEPRRPWWRRWFE